MPAPDITDSEFPLWSLQTGDAQHVAQEHFDRTLTADQLRRLRRTFGEYLGWDHVTEVLHHSVADVLASEDRL